MNWLAFFFSLMFFLSWLWTSSLCLGSEYPAVVEFSPCQKLPHKTRRRPDPKLGTIEKGQISLSMLACALACRHS